MHYAYISIVFLMLSACQPIDDIGLLVPPTVDQDAALPSVQVQVAGRNRLLHVKTYGDPNNPVLFVLHGTYSDTRPYRNICESLAGKYYVVAWDQRGCGLSERITEDEFTLEYAVDEINAMKAIYAPDKKITIIGQSWGGGLATRYTSGNPGKVAQLALLEPMPLTGADMQKLYKTIVEFSYFDQSWNNLARHGQALSPNGHEQLDYRGMMILKSTMTRAYHCNGDDPPRWPVHRVGAFVEYVRNKRLGNPVTSGFTYDFRDGIRAFGDTVLILGGSCSSLGYAMQVQYTKPHFVNARVVEIKDAGHRMNIEKFPEVMAALTSYLKEYRNE